MNESGDIVIEGLIKRADPDLELKGGEGVSWLFVLLQFILMRLSIIRVKVIPQYCIAHPYCA